MSQIKIFKLYPFIIILLFLVSGIVNSASSLYEDAEDGSINGWRIYDKTPPGAVISNIYDADKNSQVIVLTGSERNNGYQLGDYAGNQNAWDNRTQTTISWDMKYAEAYTIYISVETSEGHRFLYYTPLPYSIGQPGSNNNYIHHGLGGRYSDGQWHTVKRNLQADLHEFDANNSIISVNSFLIRGNGRLDNIALSSQPDNDDFLTETEAARFLTQATFGPTEANINALVSNNDLEA